MEIEDVKVGTYSNDRSSQIDGYVYLINRLPELEEKWKEEDGLEHEAWFAMDYNSYRKMIVSKNLHNSSKAEFSLEIECEEYIPDYPDFEGTWGCDDHFMNWVENKL